MPTKQAEQQRAGFMRFIGLVVAMAWIEFWNVPFDEVFYPGGIRVRVTITKVVSAEDTQPVRSEA